MIKQKLKRNSYVAKKIRAIYAGIGCELARVYMTTQGDLP